MDKENIKSVINDIVSNYEIVSFDIFGTLVFRHVQCPEQVFELTAKKILRDDASIKKYVKNRIKIEKELKKKGEAHFDAIYEKIGYLFPKEYLELKEAEISVEYEMIYPNEEMISILRLCKEIEKIVIIVSDMYYPESILKKFLEFNDIVDYSRLYISSDYNVTKASGKLWEIIKKRYENEKIIHIGDAIKGDFFRPLFNGIDAFWYRRNGKGLYVGKNGCRSI